MMKHQKIPIATITAYDATFAPMASENGIDIILIGDSLMVQGFF
jgi:ketopantoate hydroxymethyltransferase